MNSVTPRTVAFFIQMYLLDYPRCGEWLRQKSLAENETKTRFVNEVLNTSASLSPSSALAVIVAESGWRGAVMDSGFDTESIAGYGNDLRELYCDTGPYSITIQKDSSVGILVVLVIQGNDAIDKGFTGADYGIVSLSGSCGSIGVGMEEVTEAVQMGKVH